MAGSAAPYNARVLGVLLPAVVAVCLAHPVELDQEIARRAQPWLPPDVSRQLTHHEADFRRGATAAANWPAVHHVPGGSQGVESIIIWQCQRMAEGIRTRMPFTEVVAGFGALAHLTVDLNRPFADPRDGAYARAFSSYALSARARIPWVFYGQDGRIQWAGGSGLAPLLAERRRDMAPLRSIVREDLERVGGAANWGRLDDRSSTFGAASLTLNHAASDFVNLSSWVWRSGGGLVPDIRLADNSIIVWRGEATSRDDTRRPVISIRKARH